MPKCLASAACSAMAQPGDECIPMIPIGIVALVQTIPANRRSWFCYISNLRLKAVTAVNPWIRLRLKNLIYHILFPFLAKE